VAEARLLRICLAAQCPLMTACNVLGIVMLATPFYKIKLGSSLILSFLCYYIPKMA